MATIAEKLVAVVGADITQYTAAVGRQVPALAKTTANAVKRAGRVGAAGLRAMSKAGKIVARTLTSVASAAGRVLSTVKNFAASWVKRGLLALSAGAAAATHQFLGFDAAMREVWSITNISRKELDKLGESVKELAVEFAQDPRQMARALYQTISAGVSATDAIDLLTVASKAAIAGVTDTFTAVDALTTIINSYGMSVKDAGKVSDILFKTVEQGKTTFPELAGSIGRVAAIASQARVPFSQIGAAIATLTKGGLSTEEAMTSLRQTIVSIIKPSEDAKELAEELGIRFNAQALAAGGLAGVLKDVREKTKGNITEITRLFPNIRALSGVLSLAGSQAGEFSKQLVIMRNAAGATDSAVAKMRGPLFELKQAYAKVKVALTEIGEVIGPFFIEPLKSSAETMRNVAKRIIEHKDEIQITLGNLWMWIIEKMNWLKTEGKTLLDKIKGDHETIWDAIKEKATNIWNKIAEVWEGAKTLLSPVISALGDALAGDWQTALDKLKGAAGAVVGEILDILEEYLPDLVDMGLSLLSSLLDGILGKGEKGGIGERIGKLVGMIIGAFTKHLPDLLILGTKLGIAIAQGIIKGLKETFTKNRLSNWLAGLMPVQYGAEEAQEALGRPSTPEEYQEYAEEIEPGQWTLEPQGGRGREGTSSRGGAINVVNNFHYRTDRREQEKIARDLARLAGRGRLNFGY